jgi:hypothetical protein
VSRVGVVPMRKDLRWTRKSSYCRHRPLLVEEVDYSTKISCSKCGKYLQGRFAQQ